MPWASVGILSRASRAKATARVLSRQAEVWLPPGEAKVGAVSRSQVCAKCLHPETSPPPTPRTTLTFPGSQERKLITYSSLVKMYPSSSFRMPNRVPTTRAMPTGKDKGTAWTGQPEAMTQLGSAQCYSCTIRPLPDTPACCAESPELLPCSPSPGAMPLCQPRGATSVLQVGVLGQHLKLLRNAHSQAPLHPISCLLPRFTSSLWVWGSSPALPPMCVGWGLSLPQDRCCSPQQGPPAPAGLREPGRDWGDAAEVWREDAQPHAGKGPGGVTLLAVLG